jgi:hypothetical protein
VHSLPLEEGLPAIYGLNKTAMFLSVPSGNPGMVMKYSTTDKYDSFLKKT